MKPLEDVAIFWDYENCPAPSNASGYTIASNICSLAHPFGSVKLFKAYLEIPEQLSVSNTRSLVLRSELQSSGVTLVDCPHNGRKDVADKMMLVDMLAHAIDNPAPSTIILISGDRDFAYALSILRLRRYRVILVTLSNAHMSLTAQAALCFYWATDILDVATARPVQNRQLYEQPQPQHSTVPLCLPRNPSRKDIFGMDDDVDMVSYLSGRMQHSRRSSCILQGDTNTEEPRPNGRLSRDFFGDPSSLEHGKQVILSPKVTTNTAPPASSSPARGRNSPSLPLISATIPPNNLSTMQPFTPIVDNVSGPASNREPGPSLGAKRDTFSSPPSYEDNRPEPSTPCKSSARKISDIESALCMTTRTLPQAGTPDVVRVSTSPYFPSPQIHIPSASPITVPTSSSFEVGDRNGSLNRSPLATRQQAPIRPTPSPGRLSPIGQYQPKPVLSSNGTRPYIPAIFFQQVPATANQVNEQHKLPGGEPWPPMSPIATHTASSKMYPPLMPQAPVSTGKPAPQHIPPNQFSKAPTQPILSTAPAQVPTESLELNNVEDVALPTAVLLSPASTQVPAVRLSSNVDTIQFRAHPNPISSATFTPAQSMHPTRAPFENLMANVNTIPPKSVNPADTGAEEATSASRDSSIVKPKAIPATFTILVHALQSHRLNGLFRPSRSNVAIQIAQGGATYKSAGVKKFSQYAAMAQKEGIVELGGSGGDAWIDLLPEWYDAVPV